MPGTGTRSRRRRAAASARRPSPPVAPVPERLERTREPCPVLSVAVPTAHCQAARRLSCSCSCRSSQRCRTSRPTAWPPPLPRRCSGWHGAAERLGHPHCWPACPGRTGATSPAAGSGPCRPAVPPPHQRLVHETSQQVEHVGGLEPRAPGRRTRAARVGADRLGGLQRAAPGEDRQAGEERAAPARQQVVAPVHGRLEGLVARQGGAAAPRQEPEAVLQPRPASCSGGSTRTRAAANSMASGIPSSRAQICGHRGRVLRR